MSGAQAQSEISAREQELRQRGFRYTPCYCEESAYFLCEQLLAERPNHKLYCVFISNNPRMVDFWLHRRAAADQQVVWDYHVIVLEVLSDGRTTVVWDLDTTEKYRLVPCKTFLEKFASDRSHMRDASGNWISPPPEYPCIQARDGTTNNLEKYIHMEEQPLTSLHQLQPQTSRTSAQPYTSTSGDRPYGGVLNELPLLHEFGVDPQSDLPRIDVRQ